MRGRRVSGTPEERRVGQGNFPELTLVGRNLRPTCDWRVRDVEGGDVLEQTFRLRGVCSSLTPNKYISKFVTIHDLTRTSRSFVSERTGGPV